MKQLIVCLGSGGIRGFTHIGVLKALEENKIVINGFCGTSVGSLVSVFSASGLTALQIEDLALAIKPFDLLDLTFPMNGFIRGQKLKRLVEKHTSLAKIESLNIPVHIVATQADNGSMCVFSSGSAAERVQASCAIPNVFRPASVDGKEYLDGDLKSPVPMKLARQLFPKSIVLGVSIIARIEQAPRGHRLWSKWVAKDTYRRSLVDHEKESADLFMDIDIGYFGGFKSTWAHHQIQVGYQETMKIIPQLKQLLDTV
jgi:NTE family protein